MFVWPAQRIRSTLLWGEIQNLHKTNGRCKLSTWVHTGSTLFSKASTTPKLLTQSTSIHFTCLKISSVHLWPDYPAPVVSSEVSKTLNPAEICSWKSVLYCWLCSSKRSCVSLHGVCVCVCVCLFRNIHQISSPQLPPLTLFWVCGATNTIPPGQPLRAVYQIFICGQTCLHLWNFVFPSLILNRPRGLWNKQTITSHHSSCSRHTWWFRNSVCVDTLGLASHIIRWCVGQFFHFSCVCERVSVCVWINIWYENEMVY